MPDTSVTIGEDGSDDYSLLSVAEAAEQKTLGTDEVFHFYIRDNFAAGYLEESALLSIEGWGGVTSTAYVIVEAYPGEETDGTPNSGARIQFANFFGIIELRDSYSVVAALELHNSGTGSNFVVKTLNSAGSTGQAVRNCLVTSDATDGGTGESLIRYQTSTDNFVENCVLSFEAADTPRAIWLHHSEPYTIRNVVIHNGGIWQREEGSDLLVQNTACYTDEIPFDLSGNITAGSGGNASKNGGSDTLPGVNNLEQNLVDGTDWIDLAGLDATLPEGSALISAGVDSGLATDILGDSWGDEYEIGPYAYAEPASEPVIQIGGLNCERLDYGSDGGSVWGESDGKIGFYGATPVAKTAVTATAVTAIGSTLFSEAKTGVWAFKNSTAAAALVERTRQLQTDVDVLMTQLKSLGLV